MTFDGNVFSQVYYLRAQVVPVDPQHYASTKDNISKLRCDHALYLYKPEESEEEQKLGNPSGKIKSAELHKTLSVDVGGVAGIGSSKASAKIWLEKGRFEPWEKLIVHIDMDNSQCKKPVKSFKCKLFRRITCYGGIKNAGPLLTKEEFLREEKFNGCDEKVNHKRVID